MEATCGACPKYYYSKLDYFNNNEIKCPRSLKNNIKLQRCSQFFLNKKKTLECIHEI